MMQILHVCCDASLFFRGETFFFVLGEKRCPQLLAPGNGASGGVNDQSVSRSIVILGGNERFNFVKDGEISPIQGLMMDKRRNQLRPS